MKNHFSIHEYLKNNFDYEEEFPIEINRIELKRNSFILKENELENDLYFIVDGIVESGMNKNGENHIIDFFFFNQFFTALIPLITRKPSDTYLLCVTDCVIEKINYESLNNASKNSLIVNKLLRRLSELALMQRLKKEKQMATLSAEEMYLDLIKNRPYILQQISVKKIAQYLGVHPASLSRIRKQIK